MKRIFHVCIMASRSRTLYVGVTSNLLERVYTHRQKLVPGFTQRYRIDRLVYFAELGGPVEAITYEKRIKTWSRARKIALIESNNPTWVDLSKDWYQKADFSLCSK